MTAKSNTPEIEGIKEPQWKYDEYSPWARLLAKTTTRRDLEKQHRKLAGESGRLKDSHHRAVMSTTSMAGQSQRRAHSRNAMVGNYEERMAVENALEIYRYYPEWTKEAAE